MRRFLPALAILTLAPLVTRAETPAPAGDTARTVAWDSPSENARGSMPLGNGDIGANVWVEKNGDLVLLVGKSDSFDEFNRLLKLGRIRIKTTPALFSPGDKFTQTLRTADGVIEIATPTAKLRVWIDANRPVVQVDFESAKSVSTSVTLENWRKANRVLGKEGPGAHSTYGNWSDKHRVNADTLLPAKPGRLAWCHHNVESQWRKNLEHTALGDEVAKGRDPILDRSFGAVVRGDGFETVSDTELKKNGTAFSLRIVPLTTSAPSPEAWLEKAEKLAAEIPADTAARYAAHTAWWHDFWNRSHIDITPANPADSAAAAKTASVTRAYALQRFVTACAGRGNLPIKFNGSLFTVDGNDPDFRAWGGAYWWQNTREAYWAMPYAGDYDMMEPLFRMYREALPLRMAATKKYYGHEGAFYPETMYLWGNYTDENYGFDRKGKPDGLTDNTYIRRYWQSGIELVTMMLDAHDGSLEPKFRDDTLLPIAKQITLFFDQHWKRDATGKIRFDPAQSLETWHTAVNPLPEIAGLRFVLPRLLALPTDAATKTHWRKLLADLPPTPVAKDKAGKERIMPAETFGNKSNMENPELYGVFPYRTYTAMTGGKELELGLNAWKVRRHPEDKGWQQNVIQAPLLGLAKESQSMVVGRAAHTAGGYRFPGFFGPNYDWTPEQCHGTNMMTGLQRMLMQCEGDRIVLLPAWPKDWNADFKLHAPKNTVVSARVENGELKDLVVTPESRRKDVEIRAAQ
jgi:alpha-L-fucosidase 2